MLFLDALKALQEGKYVARAEWKDAGKYLVFMPGMMAVWQILTQPNPNAGNYLFLMDDFLASDWEVMEKVEPKKDEPVAE